MRPCSNSTLITLHLKVFWLLLTTQALYQAHLWAQLNQIGQQGTALPKITNQGTTGIHPPSVHASGASSPPIQQPVLPQPLAPQVNENNASEFFSTRTASIFTIQGT